MALQSRAANLAIEVNRERAMAEALSLEIREREMRESELQRLAETDPLTGLKNRRAMEIAIPACLAQASIREQAVCFILCDLDHFKAVNDTYGHAAGDQTLFSVAERLSGRIRAATDVLARFGGEEFALCLPGADLRRALIIAEDLRRSISEPTSSPMTGGCSAITASFGVAECLDGESFGSIFARATRRSMPPRARAATGLSSPTISCANRNQTRAPLKRAGQQGLRFCRCHPAHLWQLGAKPGELPLHIGPRIGLAARDRLLEAARAGKMPDQARHAMRAHHRQHRVELARHQPRHLVKRARRHHLEKALFDGSPHHGAIGRQKR